MSLFLRPLAGRMRLVPTRRIGMNDVSALSPLWFRIRHPGGLSPVGRVSA
jgi:hypothetical protein